MAVLGWTDQHAAPGSPVTISAKLTAPTSIVQSILFLNDVPAMTIGGEDLRQTLMFTFPAPITPGRYRVNISALDARGCRDETGLPRLVIVP